jgi:hypothetical protein
MSHSTNGITTNPSPSDTTPNSSNVVPNPPVTKKRGLWRKKSTTSEVAIRVPNPLLTLPSPRTRIGTPPALTNTVLPLIPTQNQDDEEKETPEAPVRSSARIASIDVIIRPTAKKNFWRKKSPTNEFIRQQTTPTNRSNQSKRIWRKSVSNESAAEIEKELQRPSHLLRKGSDPDVVSTAKIETFNFASAFEAIDLMVSASKKDPNSLFRQNDFSTMTVCRYCRSITHEWTQAILHNEGMQSLMKEYASKLKNLEKGCPKSEIKTEFVKKYLEMLSEYLAISQKGDQRGCMPEELKALLKQLMEKTCQAYPEVNAPAMVFSNFVFQRLLLTDNIPIDIDRKQSLSYLELNQALIAYIKANQYCPSSFEALLNESGI